MGISLKSHESISVNEYRLYIRGKIYVNHQYLEKESLVKYFQQFVGLPIDQFIKGIKLLNGQFSMVIEYLDKYILISDRIRTFPLLYYKCNKGIHVSDHCDYNTHILENQRVLTYLISGYVFGKYTIYRDLFSIQAAEVVMIPKNHSKIQSHRYFQFVPSSSPNIMSDDHFCINYCNIMEAVFRRMITSYPCANNWIIPLSGGHDSRQVANFFYKMGIKNVICYSYGKKGNHESSISKQVADALGFKWYFVEYTEEKWHKLHQTKLIEKYFKYSFNAVSTPHIQDLLALYEMIQEKIICENDIVIPGHALDMIAGSHFSDKVEMFKSKTDVIEELANRYNPLLVKGVVKDSLCSELMSIFPEENGCKYNAIPEFVNWQERQAKFITNSCRAYEFFGLKFHLPFWDKEILDLFLSLSDSQRKNRQFYKRMELRLLEPSLRDIPFSEELIKRQTNSLFIGIIKKHLPIHIRSYLAKALKIKAYRTESLNQIYVLEANSVGDLIGPLDIYPASLHKYLRGLLIRPVYNLDANVLTTLYVYKLLNYS